MSLGEQFTYIGTALTIFSACQGNKKEFFSKVHEKLLSGVALFNKLHVNTFVSLVR